MTCPYKNNREVFENYILGRLSSGEKEEFDKHLKECLVCQRKLEKERSLILALREIGKEEMKQEITEQASILRAERSSIDWSLYMKVAAAVLFFVIAPGIIYYYQNISPEIKSLSSEQHKKGVEIPAEPAVAPETEADELSQKDFSRPDMVKSKKIGTEDQNSEIPQAAMKEEQSILPESPISSAPVGKVEGDEKETGRLSPQATAGSSSRLFGERDQEKSTKTETPDAAGQEMINAISGSLNHVSDSLYIFSKQTPLQISKRTGETRIHRAKSGPVKWILSSNKENILITLLKSDQNFTFAGPQQFPLKCPVEITKKDSTGLNMIWLVPERFITTDHATPEIVEYLPASLTIRFESSVLYRIDLTKINTEALLLTQEQ